MFAHRAGASDARGKAAAAEKVAATYRKT